LGGDHQCEDIDENEVGIIKTRAEMNNIETARREKAAARIFSFLKSLLFLTL
jgi:hypothetical protein